jgi:hypothetical protein
VGMDDSALSAPVGWRSRVIWWHWGKGGFGKD